MKSDKEDHRFLPLSDFCIRGWVAKGGLWFDLFITYCKKASGVQRQGVVRRLIGKMARQTWVSGLWPRCGSRHKSLKVVWPAVLSPDVIALKTYRLSCPQWDSLVSPSPGKWQAETTGVGGPVTAAAMQGSQHRLHPPHPGPSSLCWWLVRTHLCVVFWLKLTSFTTVTYSPPSFFLLSILIMYFRIYSQAEIFHRTRNGMFSI